MKGTKKAEKTAKKPTYAERSIGKIVGRASNGQLITICQFTNIERVKG